MILAVGATRRQGSPDRNLDSGIFSSGLDGSGAAALNIAGALATTVRLLAIDPGSGRVFWVNEQPVPSISFAALDGSGGPAAQLYRAARSFAYQWQRDGADVSGATAETLQPTKPGSYSCRVTASNHAGSTASTSTAVRIKRGLVHGPKVAKAKRGRALLRLRRGGDLCDGVVRPSARLKTRRAQIGEAHFSIPPGRSNVIRVRLTAGASGCSPRTATAASGSAWLGPASSGRG